MENGNSQAVPEQFRRTALVLGTDGLTRLLGMLDLIALPVFVYASVQKARG